MTAKKVKPRVITFDGDIHFANANEVREVLFDAVREGARDIVVDLSRVEFLDSCAIGVLIKVLKLVQDRGGRLILAGVNRHIHKILDITHLNNVLETRNSVDEALADLKSSKVSR
jgi:anti-sigma B factor antagonist